MARYEFVDDKSSKFWEIEIEGASVTTRWGRIGTEGQTKTKALGDEASAQKEHDKLVKAKTKKGYLLATGVEPSQGATTASAMGNAELEAAIEADPGNPENYLVYGDWLQEQGHARGELIALQNKENFEPGAAKAKQAAAAYIKAHEDSLCAEFAEALTLKRGYRRDQSVLELDWYMGFIRSVNFETGYYDRDGDRGGEDAAKMFAAIMRSPSARFVQEVIVGDVWCDEMLDFSEIVDVLGDGPKTLRKLVVERSDFDISGVTCDVGLGGKPSPFNGGCPNLEEVLIEASDLSIGIVDLPKVRDFRLQSGGLPRGTIKEVCAAKWPKLETLHLWFGAEEYGGHAKIKDVEPILAAGNLPSLTHLGLMNAEITDDFCRALPSSAIAAQLEILDLSMGTMTAEGAQALAEGKAAFPKLKRLHLDENSISEAGQALLQGFCDTVDFGSQEDEEDRYVSIGE